jgi:hypothetical protein
MSGGNAPPLPIAFVSCTSMRNVTAVAKLMPIP